jgi:hypothetical protein
MSADENSRKLALYSDPASVGRGAGAGLSTSTVFRKCGRSPPVGSPLKYAVRWLNSSYPSIPWTIGVLNVYRSRIRNAVVVATGLLLLSCVITDRADMAVTLVQARFKQASQFQYSPRSVVCTCDATFGLLFTPDGANLPCLGPECKAELAWLVCVTLDSPLALDALVILAITSVPRGFLDPISVLRLLTDSEDLRALPQLLL